MDFNDQLQRAIIKRSKRLLNPVDFGSQSTLRIFNGSGDGEGPFEKLSIDKYGEHAWVTFEGSELPRNIADAVAEACKKLSFLSAAVILRHKKGDETKPASTLFGELPKAYVVENCGLKYEVRFFDQRHPGLFLDLDFVRHWLLKNSLKKNVLNLFSYTGSLSVAAGCGGADLVTSVDLSKPFTQWAATNWTINGLPESKSNFVFGDSFDWLKRFKKQGKKFDIIVCDPPSFSRSKKAEFSTSKDLPELHGLMSQVLEAGGYMVSSINSQAVSRKLFLKQINEGAQLAQRKFKTVEAFGLPPEFKSTDEADYLKGVVLKDMTPT